jgi:hypothetical protein
MILRSRRCDKLQATILQSIEAWLVDDAYEGSGYALSIWKFFSYQALRFEE